MKKISRRTFIKRGLLASFGLVMIDGLWFETYMIDYNYFDISNHKKNKIKIIQLSDLHLHAIQSFHKSIAKKINNANTDLLFITGDTVDKTEEIDILKEFLNLIDNSISKFAITGNKEYSGKVDLTKLKKVFKQYNCELLINENKTVRIKNRNISIIGIDDYIGGNADFLKSTTHLKPSDTNIVLTHCPAHRDIIEKQKKNLKIDIVLSGHTHGGQLNLFGFAPFKPRGSGTYLSGWYKDKEPIMYVSRGIGTSILPIRLGARAEMATIVL